MGYRVRQMGKAKDSRIVGRMLVTSFRTGRKDGVERSRGDGKGQVGKGVAIIDRKRWRADRAKSRVTQPIVMNVLWRRVRIYRTARRLNGGGLLILVSAIRARDVSEASVIESQAIFEAGVLVVVGDRILFANNETNSKGCAMRWPVTIVIVVSCLVSELSRVRIREGVRCCKTREQDREERAVCVPNVNGWVT